MKRIVLLLLRSSPKRAAIATVAGILSGVCSAGIIVVVNKAIDGGVGNVALMIAFAVAVLFKLVTHAFSQILLNKFAQRTIAGLRRDLSRKMLAAPIRELERIGPPRLLASLTDDVIAIAEALTALPRTAVNLAIIAGLSLYLIWLSPLVFAGLVGFAFIGILSYRFFLRRALKSMAKARDVQDRMFRHLRSLTDGLKELKLHRGRRGHFLTNGIDTVTADFETHNVAAQTKIVFAFCWSQLIFFVLIGLLLFLLPALRETSSETLSGYVLSTLYLLAPLTIVIDTLPVLGRAGVALDKIEGLGLSLAEASHAAQDETASAPTWRRLEVDDVSFAYDAEAGERRFVLGPVNLEIKPGEVLFLVGGNGSGKSTLAKIITGLYAPNSGAVRLDGEVIDDSNRDAYRQLFSAVFSDFYLFESLKGLGVDNVDTAGSDYIEHLRLAHKVQVEDGSFSTVELSQGQRKRLALVTAYIEDRPIYVFDEWAADQDPEFKDVFYKELLPELKRRGKAVVVISHDDRYFDVSDRTVKLDEGRFTDAETPAF